MSQDENPFLIPPVQPQGTSSDESLESISAGDSPDDQDSESEDCLYISRNESRLRTPKLRCCKGKVADITGSGMRMLVSSKDLPEVGDVQEYRFSDGETDLVVSGTVKWTRPGTAFSRRCEVGIEFCSLEPNHRDAVIRLAVQGKLGNVNKQGIDVEFPDLYKLLGVTEFASQAEIDKAFKVEAKKWHPDHNNAPNASETFDQLRKAHLLLSDVELRAKYDERFFQSERRAA